MERFETKHHTGPVIGDGVPVQDDTDRDTLHPFNVSRQFLRKATVPDWHCQLHMDPDLFHVVVNQAEIIQTHLFILLIVHMFL